MTRWYNLLVWTTILVVTCRAHIVKDRNHCQRRQLLLGCSFGWAFPLAVQALSPNEAAQQYDRYARDYDRLDGGQASSILGIEQARQTLMEQARGNVLEIGVGTGLNLDKYIPGRISSLTLVDISDNMLRQASNKVQSLSNLQNVPISWVRADATVELIDRFGVNRFDTVVDTFSLCVMGNEGARQCLYQISQVVKSKQAGGQVLLLENSRSSNPMLGLYQDATADAVASAGGKGCIYNQDVASLIKNTGRLCIEKEQLYSAGLFRSYICTRCGDAS